jgi:hypothetical protein
MEFWQMGKLIKKVICPKDLTFGHDQNGFYVKSKDGMDYHPTAEDIKAKNFIGIVRQQIRINRQKRREIRSIEAQFDKFANKVNVTIQDSRLAGNCISGTLAYISNRYKIDRDAAMRAHASIPAKQLDKKNPLVKGAILAAIRRETMVCI